MVLRPPYSSRNNLTRMTDENEWTPFTRYADRWRTGAVRDPRVRPVDGLPLSIHPGLHAAGLHAARLHPAGARVWHVAVRSRHHLYELERRAGEHVVPDPRH